MTSSVQKRRSRQQIDISSDWTLTCFNQSSYILLNSFRRPTFFCRFDNNRCWIRAWAISNAVVQFIYQHRFTFMLVNLSANAYFIMYIVPVSYWTPRWQSNYVGGIQSCPLSTRRTDAHTHTHTPLSGIKWSLKHEKVAFSVPAETFMCTSSYADLLNESRVYWSMETKTKCLEYAFNINLCTVSCDQLSSFLSFNTLFTRIDTYKFFLLATQNSLVGR